MLLRWKGMAGAPYIAALIVHASARGCGVGTALVATAEAESARAGAASLFLCVSDFNLGARRLCVPADCVARILHVLCALLHVATLADGPSGLTRMEPHPLSPAVLRVGMSAWASSPWACCRTTSSQVLPR